jgi:hypothetical protein
LLQDYATGLLTRAEYARASQAAKTELGRIEGLLARYSATKTATGLIPVGQSVRDAWQASSSDDWLRAVLSLVIKQVIVNPAPSMSPVMDINGKRMRFAPEFVEIMWSA